MSLNIGILSSAYKAAAPSGTLLLDDYPNAAAAYSLRKLRSAYSGSAIRVRRSSDNTETDIGFNIVGELDTTALLAFCGVGNGFVTTWYDQSTNVRNATQATLASQPQIVATGTLYFINTKPCIWFNVIGGGKILQNTSINITQPDSIFVVTRPTQFLANSNLFDGLTARQAIFAAGTGQISFFAGSVQASSTNWSQTNHLINAIFNGVSSVLYKNNALLLSANSGSNGLNGLTLGGFPSGGSFWAAYIPEFIIWNTNQSTNRVAINTNINSFYNIY